MKKWTSRQISWNMNLFHIVSFVQIPPSDPWVNRSMLWKCVLSQTWRKNARFDSILQQPHIYLKVDAADWKDYAEKGSGFQACVSNLVRDNGYTHVVSGPTRGDSLLDIFLPKPENSLISCNILPGISDHNGVLLEVEWDEIYRSQSSKNSTTKQMF